MKHSSRESINHDLLSEISKTESKSSYDNGDCLNVGVFYTPIPWAQFAIEQFDLFTYWMQGATVFDPTAGEGHLIEALIEYGLNKGLSLQQLPIHNLYANEICPKIHNKAIIKFKSKYGISFEDRFTCADVFDLYGKRYDIVFGNPPWITYASLPDEYKIKVRPYFVKYGLVKKNNSVLLGNSRIDLAALVVKKVIFDLLNDDGLAVFFLPLSIFTGYSANQGFRDYMVGDRHFALIKIFDCTEANVFSGVNTKYCIASFRCNQKPIFPIPYFYYKNGQWHETLVRPLLHDDDPLVDINMYRPIEPLRVKKYNKPRSGINTCGANHVFIFDNLIQESEEVVIVSNKLLKNIRLPYRFVYPLVIDENLKIDDEDDINEPKRWILIPYHSNGDIITYDEMQKYPLLFTYLSSFESLLRSRKGTMIRTAIMRGNWWALLGVGPYAFAPYKVFWKSYAGTKMHVAILKGNWQANQALHAYIPALDINEAKRIAQFLRQPEVEAYLKSYNTENTKNWAQPGKIERLLKYQ